MEGMSVPARRREVEGSGARASRFVGGHGAGKREPHPSFDVRASNRLGKLGNVLRAVGTDYYVPRSFISRILWYVHSCTTEKRSRKGEESNFSLRPIQSNPSPVQKGAEMSRKYWAILWKTSKLNNNIIK